MPFRWDLCCVGLLTDQARWAIATFVCCHRRNCLIPNSTNLMSKLQCQCLNCVNTHCDNKGICKISCINNYILSILVCICTCIYRWCGRAFRFNSNGYCKRLYCARQSVDYLEIVAFIAYHVYALHITIKYSKYSCFGSVRYV